MLFRSMSALLALLTVVLSTACTPQGDAAPAATASRSLPARPAQTTVLWISVDGLRHDFVARTRAPFFSAMASQGAAGRIDPGFPSLTFPSHTTQATGVPAGAHGIIGNSILDIATGKRYFYPQGESLLQAEPIWKTATRQGVRAAVFDWPLSQMQQGTSAAAVFNPGNYDPTLSDAQRLGQLTDAYESDASETPLRLLMGYVKDVDYAGHACGPDTKETDAAVRDADKIVAAAVARVQARFDARKRPGDALVVLVTSDHGMADVRTLVNLEACIDPTAVPEALLDLDASGPVANVFVVASPATRDAAVAKVAAMIRKNLPADVAAVYTRAGLPREWGYAHATRTGDLVVTLTPGHTFAGRIGGVTVDSVAAGGPRGMHGHVVDGTPAMLGWIAVTGDGTLRGKSLGTIKGAQLHATVARWLAIAPAKDAAPAVDFTR